VFYYNTKHISVKKNLPAKEHSGQKLYQIFRRPAPPQFFGGWQGEFFLCLIAKLTL